jgi:hypothetical protein
MTNLTHEELLLLQKILLRYEREDTDETATLENLFMKFDRALKKEESK